MARCCMEGSPHVRSAPAHPPQIGGWRGGRTPVTAYSTFFDHVLTRSDAEAAHRAASAAIRAAGPATAGIGRRIRAAVTPVPAMGLTFPGVLGLAAGFDKNATGIDGLAALGFASIEIGTVTAEPQPGNPTPRLFRLPQDRAIVNRMGFNNDGAEVVARRLARRAERRRADPSEHDVVLGVNIGKTKVVPDDQATADYVRSTRLLSPYADYLVVNVSSPNTPGLRDLQAVAVLEPLLRAVRRAADQVRETRVPVLVKIAPELYDDDVLAVADLALEVQLDGIVATNTTTSRTGLRSSDTAVSAVGTGGLSGPPLTDRADQVMRMLRDRVGPGLTLVGVGGIDTPADAQARLAAGATLLQAYTGFVYGGPLWPARMQRALDGPSL